MMISLENRDLGDQYKSWETVVPTYPSLIEKHFALSKKCREGYSQNYLYHQPCCHEFYFFTFYT